MDAWFVTGTDTGVGKTLIAAALVHALARGGRRAVGMKPVAAGAVWRDGALRNEDVETLIAAANVTVPRDAVCPVLLPQPVAPHIAAELAGVRIFWRPIQAAFDTLQAQVDAVVVEGVGGFRVPLAPDFDTADLARSLGLPVVLVVGLRLGCLNHALLTAEAIAARGLRLQAWVGNRIDPMMAEADRNLETLRGLLPAPCMGVVPHMAWADFRAVADLLDLGAITG